MRSHKFISSPLYLVIQLVVKESKSNENNAGIRHLRVLFLNRRDISQVSHFKLKPHFDDEFRILQFSCIGNPVRFFRQWMHFADPPVIKLGIEFLSGSSNVA